MTQPKLMWPGLERAIKNKWDDYTRTYALGGTYRTEAASYEAIAGRTSPVFGRARLRAIRKQTKGY